MINRWRASPSAAAMLSRRVGELSMSTSPRRAAAPCLEGLFEADGDGFVG